MVCKGCGVEIAKGTKECGGCGIPNEPDSDRKSSTTTCLIVAIVVFIAGFFLFWILDEIPNIKSRNYVRYIACLQRLQSISKGMQDYVTEKGDFNGLPKTGGNGDVICNYILPGAEKAEDCIGRVSEKTQEHCHDYKVDISSPDFQYEITGHSDDMIKCGICVTEAGYCPEKYSGKERADSHCKKSCVDAGINSTAVCPH